MDEVYESGLLGKARWKDRDTSWGGLDVFDAEEAIKCGYPGFQKALG